jgi:hypothetical protein
MLVANGYRGRLQAAKAGRELKKGMSMIMLYVLRRRLAVGMLLADMVIRWCFVVTLFMV